MFGYGFTFGEKFINPFIGIGDYFFDPEREDGSTPDKAGTSYALFLFQMSFATTTSTIVSAGMAERIHLQSHCFVSFFITLVHSVAGHWVWHRTGVFRTMGVIDSAGCSAVHLVGGMSGLVATLYLKPRQHRFKDKRARQISDPTKAILGKNKIIVVSNNTGSTGRIATLYLAQIAAIPVYLTARKLVKTLFTPALCATYATSS
ncbi:ammonium transporter [Ancylostoma caninum]|uniref:Ammonium transporter n=1 Tax=Ancylostoma caninum TaxID=29170 RepID=A0A368H574_ANCCA|nr:ammonium transporter [Ancylostoma caninum]